MSENSFNQQRFQKAFLLLLVVSISVFFISMIRQFLMTLFLAALCSGIVHPMYRRIRRWFKGRKVLASLVSLVIVFILIIGPSITLLSIVGSEAYEVSQSVPALIDQGIPTSEEVDALIDQLPFANQLRPYQDQITEKLAEFAGNVGNFLFNGLRAATTGTATFFFQFFIMLYAMFFFLISGEDMLRRILYYMPLSHHDESRMLDRFISVTLATVKGTVVIGGIQGALAGIAFAFFGIPSATFWGAVMAVFSIIPAVGPALVWIPAVIYLMASGSVGAGIGLAIVCFLIGLIDNFLRPIIVGREAKMSDLMVLLSTLGGLALFGIVGFIIGPLIAALFQTIWDIYGYAFREVLPETYPLGKTPQAEEPVSEPALSEKTSSVKTEGHPNRQSTESDIDIWLPPWNPLSS